MLAPPFAFCPNESRNHAQQEVASEQKSTAERKDVQRSQALRRPTVEDAAAQDDKPIDQCPCESGDAVCEECSDSGEYTCDGYRLPGDESDCGRTRGPLGARQNDGHWPSERDGKQSHECGGDEHRTQNTATSMRTCPLRGVSGVSRPRRARPAR